MLGAGRVGGNEGEINLGLMRGGDLDFGFLGGFFEALYGRFVLREIDALLPFELVYEMAHDNLVEIIAAEVGVAVGGADFEDPVTELEYGNVEGAAAEVVNHDLFFGLFIEAISEGGGGGLVDDAFDLKAGNFAGVFGGLALSIVEVGRHGDNGFSNGAAEEFFGIGLELGENHGRDFFRRVVFVAHFDLHAGVRFHDFVWQELEVALHFRVVETAANEALDAKNRVIRINNRLALGHLANEAFAGF